MKKNNVRVAVIGAGYWGKNLIRNLKKIGVLCAICDTNPQRLQLRSRQFRPVKAYKNFSDVLKDDEVTAVVIATPAVLHYKMAKKALLAHKDVFVEKPLSLHVKEANELVRLAQKQKRLLMVDHILQYHPAIIKLKDLIDRGHLGKIQYIYSNRLNIGKLRKEENILWSFAPHDISVLLWLAGSVPVRVRAFGEAYLQKNVFDTTVTELTFDRKIKAHIFVSWLHPYKEQKLVVIGNKRMAAFNDLEKENKLTVYSHKVKWVEHVPVASKAKGKVISFEHKEPLAEACRHFIRCAEERKKIRTDGQEAIRVLKVLSKAQKELDKRG